MESVNGNKYNTQNKKETAEISWKHNDEELHGKCNPQGVY